MQAIQLSEGEIRDLQLRILEEFDAYCSRRGLRYTAAYGTLLGAVRHRGYIPWDDDIDVMMPREDFERLCELGSVGPFEVRSLRTERAWPFAYAKVCDPGSEVVEESRRRVRHGVNIDVFPVDRVPDAGWRRGVRLNVCRAFEALQVLTSLAPRTGRAATRAAVLRISQPILRVVLPAGKLAAGRTAHATRTRHPTRDAGVLVGSYPWHAPAAALDDTGRGVFEGIEVRLPADADAVLTVLYGRYRELPPVDQRRSHHALTAFRH